MLKKRWGLHKENTPETMVKQELLRMVSELPHLAGVVHLLKIHFTDRVDLAAVTGSGGLLINPETFVPLDSWDATFVLAHECMHLCLQHHERDFGKYPLWTNIAMDAVINDMLSQQLQMFVPCWTATNGRSCQGA